MSKATKSDILKKQIIIALEQALGVVTAACRSVGIARSTFYEWYNVDQDFKKEVDSIQEIAIDFAESQLHKQIKEGNVSAIIFYLKTKGAKRGYVEVQQHQIHAKPFTHIEIEQNFDSYEEVKTENHRHLSEKSKSKK